MDKLDYWQRCTKAMDFGVDLVRPEQVRLAGSLAILGGQANNFFTVARVTEKAVEAGLGRVKTFLPESLAKKVPKTDTIEFLATEQAGGFAKIAGENFVNILPEFDMTLVVGDLGRNAETRDMLDKILSAETKTTSFLMRDAVDLAIETNSLEKWLEREGSWLFLSMAQLKKILQAVYYPRVLNLTAPLLQTVEVLHKFSLSYAVGVICVQGDQIILTQSGQVWTVAMKDTKYNPISIFDGELVINMMKVMWWNKGMQKPLAALAAACLN